MSTNLITYQITDLSFAPNINKDVELMLQRKGFKKAEKTTLESLSQWLVSSTAFVNAITTTGGGSLSQHIATIDPHGDRAYSDSKLSSHVISTDPHGDRLYSANLINNALEQHLLTNDPHNIKPFAEGLLRDHLESEDPHGIKIYVDQKTGAITSGVSALVSERVNTKFEESLGTTIAPLVNGRVPLNHLYKNLEIKDSIEFFPNQGLSDLFYISKNTKKLYYWDGLDYQEIRATVDLSSSGLSLTTDNIPEGSLRGRHYLTTILKEKYDKSIRTINGGLVSSTKEGVTRLKDIVVGGSLVKEVKEETITVRDNKCFLKGITLEGEEVALVDGKNSLKNIDEDYLYKISGSVIAKTFENISGKKVISGLGIFSLDAIFCPTYMSKFVAEPDFSLGGFSEDGVRLKGTIEHQQASLDIYDNNMNLLDMDISATSNIDVIIDPAMVPGSTLYVVSKYKEKFSNAVIIKTPDNTKEPNPVTGFSYDSNYTEVYGNTGSSVLVELMDGNIKVGESISNYYGNFLIRLENPLDKTEYTLRQTINSFTSSQQVFLPSKTLRGLSSVVFNKIKETVSGKGSSNSLISVYTSNDIKIAEIPTDDNGFFSSSINYTLFSQNPTVKLKVVKGELESELIIFNNIDTTTSTKTPPPVMQYEAREFEPLYRELPFKRYLESAQVRLIYEDNEIKVLVKNTGTETINWSSDIEVIKEEI